MCDLNSTRIGPTSNWSHNFNYHVGADYLTANPISYAKPFWLMSQEDYASDIILQGKLP